MDVERFGRAVAPRQLEALGAESSAAARVLQACVTSHHVAEADYTDLHLKRETLRVRVASASDTGEGFTPPWPDR